MNYQWGREWRCRDCGKEQGGPLNTCTNCHWKGILQSMNEIDQKLFNAASELVEERRKLRDEAKEAAQTIAKLKRELEQASIATRALESRCAQVHDSLLVKEGQVEAYKKRLSEMTNITYDQLREHIGGVMSKHVDSVVEELKRRMGG